MSAGISELEAATELTEEERSESRRTYLIREERLRREVRRQVDAEEVAAAPSTWLPVDMSKVSHDALSPEVGHRSDHAYVFYKGHLNVVFGDSEGGKTWLVLFVAAQVLNAGKRVVMLDYEDGPTGAKVRLLKLGVPESIINNPAFFVYLNPQGAMDDSAFDGLAQTFSSAEMVIIDAFSEAAATEGVDDYRAIQVAGWYTRVPRRIAALGPAVVLIDHVNKAADGKGQQTGSQHKKSGVDGVSLAVSAVAPFAEGHSGASMVSIGKDRHSGVKKNSVSGGTDKPMRFAVFKCDEFGFWSLDPATEPLSSDELETAREFTLDQAVTAAWDAGKRTKNAVRVHVRAAGVKAGSAVIDAAFDRHVDLIASSPGDGRQP